jgi:hypothetical protein
MSFLSDQTATVTNAFVQDTGTGNGEPSPSYATQQSFENNTLAYVTVNQTSNNQEHDTIGAFTVQETGSSRGSLTAQNFSATLGANQRVVNSQIVTVAGNTFLLTFEDRTFADEPLVESWKLESNGDFSVNGEAPSGSLSIPAAHVIFASSAPFQIGTVNYIMATTREVLNGNDTSNNVLLLTISNDGAISTVQGGLGSAPNPQAVVVAQVNGSFEAIVGNNSNQQFTVFPISQSGLGNPLTFAANENTVTEILSSTLQPDSFFAITESQSNNDNIVAVMANIGTLTFGTPVSTGGQAADGSLNQGSSIAHFSVNQ